MVRRFPDIQRLLIGALTAAGFGVHAAIETPANLRDVLPFVRVRRIGGWSDRVNDHPTVDVDVFGATYAATEPLAVAVREWLVGPPSPIWQLDHVDVEAEPRELPWGEPDAGIRRWGATYRAVTRRSTST